MNMTMTITTLEESTASRKSPSLGSILEKSESAMSGSFVDKTLHGENSITTLETLSCSSVTEQLEQLELSLESQDQDDISSPSFSGKQIRKRRVHFDESLSQFYDKSECCEEEEEEDCLERWYSHEEYSEFRIFSGQIANRVMETAELGAPGNLASSFVGLMIKVYWACCEANPDDDNARTPAESATSVVDILSEPELSLLHQIYVDTGGAMLVGLERHIANQIALDVRDRRLELVYTAMDVQESEWSSNDELDAQLYLYCNDLSRPSGPFARLLAEITQGIPE